ncbi:MAG: DUF4434 domain-containing protein [Nanoarchaeota archaeon]
MTYPITGFWAYRPAVGSWAEKLDKMQRIGANKVIMLGPILKDQSSIDTIINDPRVEDLLQQARARNMDVFLGLPKPPSHKKYPWDVAQDTLEEFFKGSQKILEGLASKYGSISSFKGVYQAFEMQIKASGNDTILNLYRRQHEQVRQTLPGKKILVSPYFLSAVKSGNTKETLLASTKQGLLNIIDTDVDIIAPQDGVGIGAGALYWRCEDTTFSAPISAFYKTCRETIDEVAPRRVQLWANNEGFEQMTLTKYLPTNKQRLDRAIMFTGRYVSDHISFMWDGYYDKPVKRSLAEEIAADTDRPIIVDVIRSGSSMGLGLRIRGYNIIGGTVNLQYHDLSLDRGGDKLISPDQCIENPDFGRSYNAKVGIFRFPLDMQELCIPLAMLGKPLIVNVNICNRQNTSAHHTYHAEFL